MRFRSSLACSATAVMLVLIAYPVHAVPVSTNLIVQVDGSSTSLNGISSGALPRWFDLATDANANSHQDFLQAAPGNRPTVVAEPFPNSSTHNVVKFARGTVGGGVNTTQSSTNSSQRLISVLGGSSANTTGGADPAYNFTSGMSVFIVFKSTLTTANASANSRQQIIRATHNILAPDSSSPGSYDRWSVNTSENNTIGPSTTTPDLFSQFRPQGNAETPSSDLIVGDLNGGWYIFGASWDLASGNLQRNYVLENLTTLSKTDTGVTRPSGLPGHVATMLGAIDDVNNTNKSAFDGMIAEVLIYNSALGSVDYNANMTYLTNKYFATVPEPSAMIMVTMGMIGAVATSYRRRLNHC